MEDRFSEIISFVVEFAQKIGLVEFTQRVKVDLSLDHAVSRQSSVVNLQGRQGESSHQASQEEQVLPVSPKIDSN